MTRTLFRDALVVPIEGGPAGGGPFTGYVVTEGERIAGLGAGAAPDGQFDQVVDAGGHALLPGFVNTHAHSHSSLTRGSAEGLPLEDWIATIEREQRVMTEEDAYRAARITYAEALQNGTTTILDMCLFPEAAARAAEEMGIRAVIAPYVADGKSFAPTLQRTQALLDRLPQGGRVQGWVGLHDLESCSDAQIREGAALAARYGTGLHLHCAESRFSTEQTRARTGRTPVEHLHTLGALGPRTLLAHCVWVSEEDRDRLARTGTAVAHCPHANLKLGSGIAPIPDMVARGVVVSLGTDGAKANNRLDPFDVMKFASLIHKGVAQDPSLLPAPQILAMATSEGARSLGVPAGRITTGAAADIILVRLDTYHLQPATPETITTNLVHAARGSDVAFVMVAGQPITSFSAGPQSGHLVSCGQFMPL